jgi:hypothetical protein
MSASLDFFKNIESALPNLFSIYIFLASINPFIEIKINVDEIKHADIKERTKEAVQQLDKKQQKEDNILDESYTKLGDLVNNFIKNRKKINDKSLPWFFFPAVILWIINLAFKISIFDCYIYIVASYIIAMFVIALSLIYSVMGNWIKLQIQYNKILHFPKKISKDVIKADYKKVHAQIRTKNN